MEHALDSKPLDTLRAITHCPWCEQQFKDLQVSVVAEQDHMQLLHFQCQACHAYVLAAISFSGMVITSVGVVSDLDRPEVQKSFRSQPVQADEILSFHHQLTNYPRSFTEQFKTIKPAA